MSAAAFPSEGERLARVEERLTDLPAIRAKLDRLESRVNYLFGGLAVLTVVANLATVLLRH